MKKKQLSCKFVSFVLRFATSACQGWESRTALPTLEASGYSTASSYSMSNLKNWQLQGPAHPLALNLPKLCS
jgi:hypothetical protein